MGKAELRKLIQEKGVAEAAKILHCRYSAVRKLAIELNIKITRGRKPDKALAERNKDIRRERKGSAYLHDIGKKHSIGRERVRQILLETGGDPIEKDKEL